MKLIAVGDTLFALNLLGSFLLDYWVGRLGSGKIQLGEHFTLAGSAAELIVLLLFIVPLAASAIWAARRSHPNGNPPPLAAGTQAKRGNSEKAETDIDVFRFSENRI
jgi:hypothetical protein